MADYEVDDVDRRLLGLLQENARHTAIEIAERIGVSDNTVHNRIERLEEAGVITGYSAAVDHEKTGLTLYFHFTCTARISERGRVADAVMELPEVLEVTELMTGQENLHVKVVAATDEEVSRIAAEIDDLALEITDENLIRAEHSKPLDFVEVLRMVDEKD